MAGVLAVVVAIIAVMGLEFVSHMIWPPPADLDMSDPESLRAAVAAAPAPAIAAVAVAWGLGALIGGAVGRLVTRGKRWPAWLAGGFILGGAIANFVMIPHPMWMLVLGPVLIALGVFAATMMPIRR